MDKHNQNARYADYNQRDDEAGARLLAEMEANDPSVTAMVIHVATAFMAEKAASN